MSDITFFGAPWCGPCNQLKRLMDDEGIEFDFKNVDEKPNEEEMLKAAEGRYLIPTVVIGERVMQNPPIALVKQAISEL